MSITNPSIAELIEDIESDRLVLRPFFQRRLVWTNTDKEFFIETVLSGFPFPEIFVSTGALDRKNVKRKKWLVDGQQRLTTLRDYIRGSENLLYRTIQRYSNLTEDQQTKFLETEVAVRDLGSKTDDEIREIFRRINSTDYALKEMEVLNAMFSGDYIKYCEQLSRHDFFEKHQVFPEGYKRRMYDVTFCVILVTTLLSGYYRRGERNEEYLGRYNDDFPQKDTIQVALDRVFDFVERCGFDADSRAWKQTDLFTLLVELYSAIVVSKLKLDAEAVGQKLAAFYDQVDRLYGGKRLPEEGEVPTGQEQIFRYLKGATKATNDKYARIDRAEVISSLIRSTLDGRAAERPEPTSGPAAGTVPEGRKRNIVPGAKTKPRARPAVKKKGDKKG